jgi:sugar transferase (PEP-CTERM system associated)
MFRFAGLHISRMSAAMAMIETMLLYLLAYGYYDILESTGYTPNLTPGIAAALITMGVIIGMSSVGMYNRRYFFRLSESASRAMVVLPLVLAFIIILLVVRDYTVEGALSPANYILCIAAVITFLPALLLLRKIGLDLLDRSDSFRSRVLVIGGGPRAGSLQNLSRDLRHRSFIIIGYARLTSEQSPVVVDEGALPDRRGDDRRPDFVIAPGNLLEFCREHQVDEIVIAGTERRGMPVHELLNCKLHGFNTVEFSSFWERESGQIYLDDMSPSWLLFSDGFQMGKGRVVVQRGLDIIVASLLLILSLPVTLVVALLIKLESEGPIFYRQVRVGLRGKPFEVVKFRSMRVDAEKHGPRWASKNDNRTTRIGAFIRKVRIDEIPQVFNVLKGDMAFVGPRPERPVFVAVLAEKIPYYDVRHAAKPGITGWAQINYPYGASVEDAKRKLALDLYYIKNGSIFLDIITMIQTGKVLLWNDGAR